MKFACISPEGAGLPFWSRLFDEGEQVLVYIDPGKLGRMERDNGMGIVPRTNDKSELEVFANEGSSVVFFDSSSLGAWADTFRKRGIPVIGSSSFCDKLEDNRLWAQKLIEHCGCAAPEIHSFSYVREAIAKARTLKGEWVFKTDRMIDSNITYPADSTEELIDFLYGVRERFGDRIRCHLQEKIPGVAVSTAAWWSGARWLYPFEGTIEHKKFLNGDLGSSTGCAFNYVWWYDDIPKIVRELHFDTLAKYMRKYEAPPGVYDINAVISEKDGKAYFLEFTPRMGYDAEPCAQLNLEEPLGSVLYKVATGGLEYMPFDVERTVLSVRLSIPPYPNEHVEPEHLSKRFSAKDQRVRLPTDNHWGLDGWMSYALEYTDDGYRCSSAGGCLGLGVDVAPPFDLVSQHERVLDVLKEVKVVAPQYRTDAGLELAKDLAKLSAIGYEVPRHKEQNKSA